MNRRAPFLARGGFVLGLALVVGALAGCGDALSLGLDPDFVWWTDHETGDLQDWLRNSPDRGTSYTAGGGTVAVTTEHARSGRFALVTTSATGSDPPAALVAGTVTRKGTLPAEAFYGAWFFVPAFARPKTYWVIFAVGAGDAKLWDVKLAADAQNRLALQLLLYDTGDVTALRAVPVPLERWFQVQAYFRSGGDTADVLRLWQDDALVFEVTGVAMPGFPNLSWSVGTLTDGLDPTPASLYVDDAFIATRRIEPDAPPFWRGPAARP